MPPTNDPRDNADSHAALHADLRRMAKALFRNEPPDHTLSPTALVHEAWLLFAAHAPRAPRADDPKTTRRIAAKLMRRLLIDHARSRATDKRGARMRVALDPDHLPIAGDLELVDVLALDEALVNLAKTAPQGARAVELRVFAQLTLSQIADTLSLSISTIRRTLDAALDHLRRELSPD